MTKELLQKFAKEFIDDIPTDKLIYIFNEYCNEGMGCSEDCIYEHDDYFFKDFFSDRPEEVARAIAYGDYRYTDAYIKWNALGNLVTLNEYNVKEEIKIDDMIEWWLDEDTDLEDLIELSTNFEEWLTDNEDYVNEVLSDEDEETNNDEE